MAGQLEKITNKINDETDKLVSGEPDIYEHIFNDDNELSYDISNESISWSLKLSECSHFDVMLNIITISYILKNVDFHDLKHSKEQRKYIELALQRYSALNTVTIARCLDIENLSVSHDYSPHAGDNSIENIESRISNKASLICSLKASEMMSKGNDYIKNATSISSPEVFNFYAVTVRHLYHMAVAPKFCYMAPPSTKKISISLQKFIEGPDLKDKDYIKNIREDFTSSNTTVDDDVLKQILDDNVSEYNNLMNNVMNDPIDKYADGCGKVILLLVMIAVSAWVLRVIYHILLAAFAFVNFDSMHFLLFT